MSSMISSPSDITVSQIEFGPVKLLDSGGKTVNLRYDSRNLQLETPSLNVPYGVNVFDKNGPPKYSVDLSLRGADTNTEVRALQDFLEAFDERMIDAGVENAGKWFKMANPSREVIKAFYTPLVKLSRDPQGNPKPYPPTFKIALRGKKGAVATTESGSFEAVFYNPEELDEKGQPTPFAPNLSIDELLGKRAQVTAIIQCTGLWFAGGKFGTTWKTIQIRVDSQPDQIRGPAFRSNAPVVSKVVPKAKAPVEEVEDEEEDEDEAPAPAKPVAPVAFQEEAVSEPVPVPRKVVKKVVKTAAK